MAYLRVIPRDLFNEADLLKCLGALSIALDNVHRRCLGSGFVLEAVDFFHVEQDPADGSISVVNLPFTVRGRDVRLYRPLNSREPWPLWLGSRHDLEFEHLRVFDEDGKLSPEFLTLIGASDG